MGKINYLRERKEERGKKKGKGRERGRKKKGKEKADLMFRRGPIKIRCFTAFCSRRAI